MTTADAARLFLRKATQDEAALVNLAADATIADEIVGFHAQQAVEKLLKAVLVFDGVRVRRTHDLAELSDLLTDHGRPMPVDVAAITDPQPVCCGLQVCGHERKQRHGDPAGPTPCAAAGAAGPTMG